MHPLLLFGVPRIAVCVGLISVNREKGVIRGMTTLNDADALVFDLRDNRGGFPSMVSLIAAYLFDHPEYIYCPFENTTAESWTRSPVPAANSPTNPCTF